MTALPVEPLSIATLLNYYGESRGSGVARLITGCECFLMRAELRTSLDF
jgi:hypothetical protein